MYNDVEPSIPEGKAAVNIVEQKCAANATEV
jgi:hypothetical protein